MSPKAPLCSNRLALAAALSLAAAAAQAQTPYLSASVKLSNLNFQLIDLNPNDGIAPSLIFLKSAKLEMAPFESHFMGMAYEATNTVVPLGGLTGSGSPLLDFNAQASNLSVATTANSLSMQSAFKASDLRDLPGLAGTETYDEGAQLATYSYLEQRNGEGNRGSLKLFGNTYPDGSLTDGYSAKLSANTALIITGQAAADVHMDRTMLDAAYQQMVTRYGDPGIGYIEGDSFALASVSLSLTSSTDQVSAVSGLNNLVDSSSNSSVSLISWVEAKALKTGIEVFDPSTNFTNLDANTHDLNKQQTFSLVSVNETGLDASLSLNLQAQANTFQYVTHAAAQVTYTDNPNYQPPELPPLPMPDPSIPSIPEPSTYALMGLGLVGIVVTRRRLRPTQAA